MSYVPGSFPDESSHMGYILNVISQNFPDYIHGKNAFDSKLNHLNHPWLYYFIVGETIRFLHVQDFVFWAKLFNTIFCCGVVYFVVQLLSLSAKSKLAILTGGLLLVIFPMFPMLAGSVNNDPINILGCTMFIYGLALAVKSYRYDVFDNISILLMAFGGVIAALSKATGALAITCVIISFFLFNSSLAFRLIKKINFIQWGVVFISVLFVAINYYWMLHHFSSFFPAPQGNPATWFAVEDLTAKRLSYSQYFDVFLHSNMESLIKPYGHVFYEDVSIRFELAKLLAVALLLTSLFIFFCGLLYKKDGDKFFVSLVFSFYLYFIFYFFTVYDLHLKTGYLGAMQARYFYGFLPVFCLILSRLIESLSLRFFRLGVCTLVFVSSILSCYPSFISLFKCLSLGAGSVITQNKMSTNYGEVIKGRVLEQSFIASGDRFIGAGLFLGTYGRVNDGGLTLRLLNDKLVVIKEVNISLHSVVDGGYTFFNFNNIKTIRDGNYSLQLICNECFQGNAITWWGYEPDIENPLYVLNSLGPASTDSYKYGYAKVDGVAKKADFMFNLYFK